jgi:hypothetical protein
MLSLAAVRQQIQRYVENSVSLDDFEDWVVSSSWNMHKAEDADKEAERLVAAVELRLAEHSSGHLDESDLKREFQVILTHGYHPSVMNVPIFRLDSESVTAIASTFQEVPPPQIVVFRSAGPTSTQTRSASSRTSTLSQTLRAAP